MPATTLEITDALWAAAYDSLCATAEQLAEECNEYWRDGDADRIRARIDELSSRFERLAALGPTVG